MENKATNTVNDLGESFTTISLNNLEEVEIRATLRQLNLLIGSARNKLLYPKLEEKRIKLPKDELSREQIERLVNDVEVIVNWVRQKISENLEGNF